MAKLPLRAGDRVLLAAGQTFAGQLTLTGVAGTTAAPMVISTYADSETAASPVAKIAAAGQLAGVVLRNAAHVRIENLDITANGGGRVLPSGANRDLRCGVLVQAGQPGMSARPTARSAMAGASGSSWP